MHIKIDFKIFIFVLVFCLTNQIYMYVLLMLFAILHEIGHLLAGIILKLKPKKIEINPLGLSITFEGMGEKFKNKIEQKKILIALAGPFVNLLIILFSAFAPLGEEKILIIYANLILLLVNLLPIYPLDGGRVLKSLLHLKLDYWTSCKIMNAVSNTITIILTIIASITVFYFKNLAIFFMVFYLWILMIQENRKYKLIEKTHNLIEKNKVLLEKANI